MEQNNDFGIGQLIKEFTDQATPKDKMIGALTFSNNFMKYFNNHASDNLKKSADKILWMLQKAMEQTEFEINYKKPEKANNTTLVTTAP